MRRREDCDVKVRWVSGLLLVVLAVAEVILIELLIRSGIVGVERATGVLFILILLNFALVAALGNLRGRE